MRPPRSAAPRDPHPARAALLDVHGPRLHGFALLVGLGDRRLAVALVAGALADATRRLDELEHPERAAAWLRAHVRRAAPRRVAPLDADERLAVLRPLGVSAPVLAGLARLDRDERAALVASDVERLDARDVATVTGRDGAALERLLQRARSRFLDGFRAAPREDGDGQPGPITSLVRATAARAMP